MTHAIFTFAESFAWTYLNSIVFLYDFSKQLYEIEYQHRFSNVNVNVCVCAQVVRIQWKEKKAKRKHNLNRHISRNQMEIWEEIEAENQSCVWMMKSYFWYVFIRLCLNEISGNAINMKFDQMDTEI